MEFSYCRDFLFLLQERFAAGNSVWVYALCAFGELVGAAAWTTRGLGSRWHQLGGVWHWFGRLGRGLLGRQDLANQRLHNCQQSVFPACRAAWAPQLPREEPQSVQELGSGQWVAVAARSGQTKQQNGCHNGCQKKFVALIRLIAIISKFSAFVAAELLGSGLGTRWGRTTRGAPPRAHHRGLIS